MIDVERDVPLMLADSLLLEPAVCQPGPEPFEQHGVFSSNLFCHLLIIDVVL